MNGTLTANLTALRLRNQGLAARIAEAPVRPEIELRTARSGMPVPVVKGDGRVRALHSLTDPLREGRRLALSRLARAEEDTSRPRDSYLVVSGLGAGYHIQPFLASSEVERILILDRDVGLIRALFERVDFTPLLTDARVVLLVDPNPQELRDYLLRDYLPALHGSLRYVTLRSRVDLDRPYFASIELQLQTAVADAATDFRAQTAFGLRWFKNILANLPLLAHEERSFEGVSEAAVVGAGPTLDATFGELLRLAPTTPIISVDTALPVLTARGLAPRYVLTVDCQQLGYHHYLSGLPAGTTLVSDLSAAPDVARLQSAPLFISGGHPFIDFIDRRLHAIPRVDSSGGNVGHAATSLAIALGAGRVHLFGLDFSYPGGATYARGSYLSPYFLSRHGRLKPLDTLDSAIFLSDPTLRRLEGDGVPSYQTSRVQAYRRSFERVFSRFSVELVRHGSGGPQLETVSPPAGRRTAAKGLVIPGLRADDMKGILSAYREGLGSLAIPRSADAAENYVASLAPREMEIFVTLIPLLAWVRGSEFGRSLSFSTAVEATLGIAREIIARQGQERLDSKNEFTSHWIPV